MLTPIEDLGFSHDVEADDSEWDDLEKVYAKLTAHWYVDPDRVTRKLAGKHGFNYTSYYGIDEDSVGLEEEAHNSDWIRRLSFGTAALIGVLLLVSEFSP